jgi:hypothetical protein
MQTYTFTENAFFKGSSTADPQVIGEILAKIQRSATVPMDQAMWRAAEGNPKHPLFGHYDWDIRSAAESHWTAQSQAIIRSIRSVDDKQPELGTVRAFHSIATPGEGRAYYTHKEVTRSADLQLRLLRQAERDLLAFERRYQELIDICEVVRGARKKVEDRIAASGAH